MQPKTYEKDNNTTPVNLIIDIGNTTAKVAFFDKGEMLCRLRTDTDHLVELLKNDNHTTQCRQAIVDHGKFANLAHATDRKPQNKDTVAQLPNAAPFCQ